MLKRRMSKRAEHYAFEGYSPIYRRLRPRIRTLVTLSRYAYQIRDLDARELLKEEYIKIQRRARREK